MEVCLTCCWCRFIWLYTCGCVLRDLTCLKIELFRVTKSRRYTPYLFHYRFSHVSALPSCTDQSIVVTVRPTGEERTGGRERHPNHPITISKFISTWSNSRYLTLGATGYRSASWGIPWGSTRNIEGASAKNYRNPYDKSLHAYMSDFCIVLYTSKPIKVNSSLEPLEG